MTCIECEENRVVITHFTNAQNLVSILEDSCIHLEGINNERAVKDASNDDMQLRQIWNDHKKQYKIAGRYVWFTEEKQANTAFPLSGDEMFGISFYADAIGAIKWSEMRKRMILKNGNRAQVIIEKLERAAQTYKDDVDKWWVCTKAVHLEDWLYRHDAWTERKGLREKLDAALNPT